MFDIAILLRKALYIYIYIAETRALPHVVQYYSFGAQSSLIS